MLFQVWLMAYCWLVKVAAAEVAATEVAAAVVTEVETAKMVVTEVTEAEGKEMGPDRHPAMGQVLVMDQVKVFMSRAQVKDPAIKFASMRFCPDKSQPLRLLNLRSIPSKS